MRTPIAAIPRVRSRRAFGETCFFAIIPDPPAAALADRHAQRLRRVCRLAGEVFAPERFHVTLLGGWLPGAPSGEVIKRMSAAAAMVSAGGFAVGFDQAMSFHVGAGRHALVLSWSDYLLGLEKLCDALEQAMLMQGLHAVRSSNPHLTLLYDEDRVEAIRVPLVRWIARDFVLIKSLQGQTHHQPLVSWPLRPIPTR